MQQVSSKCCLLDQGELYWCTIRPTAPNYGALGVCKRCLAFSCVWQLRACVVGILSQQQLLVCYWLLLVRPWHLCACVHVWVCLCCGSVTVLMCARDLRRAVFAETCVHLLLCMQHTCTSPLLFYCRKNYRVLIYNGDVDACVPYLGNEVSGVGGITQSIHCG